MKLCVFVLPVSHMSGWQDIKNSSQYDAVQNINTTNHDLSVKTQNLIITSEKL